MRLLLLSLIALGCFAQSAVLRLNSNPGSLGAATIPMGLTCTATANGTNWTVSGTGCTTGTTAQAAALTQSLVLFQLPARGRVIDFSVVPTVICAGTTTLTAGLGTATNANFFMVSATGINLMAAVGDTNFTSALPLSLGSTNKAAVNVVASLTSTVQNISSVTTGCAFEYTVLYYVRP